MNNEESIGSIERLDPAINSIVSENAQIDTLAKGFEWSEGPLWIESQKALIFSDVPKNIVYKWTAEQGAQVYLTPSGFTGTGDYSSEPGSNGLALSPDGKLVLCQHGDRKLAIMDSPLDQPSPKFITVADNYQNKKFNSPNDVVFRSNGDLFFTDPPYGLPKRGEDEPLKELPFQGVYKVSQNTVTLITDTLTRPNGIALMPDEKTLLVANSDPKKAIWYAIELGTNDEVKDIRVFYDATPNIAAGEKGGPDGLKIDRQGNVFASGPGGIWIFNKEGKVLGKIKLKERASNCALADNDKTLYITNDMYVIRVRLRS